MIPQEVMRMTRTVGRRLLRAAFRPNLFAAALLGTLAFTTTVSLAADPLPSWNEGPAKKAIVEFVTKVTKPGSRDFVPVPERIAETGGADHYRISFSHSSSVSTFTPCFLASASFDPAPGPAMT